MSFILDIYTHLAGMDVAVNGITPTAYDLDQLPDVVEPAMLPCRILLPMDSKGEGRDFSFIALGKTSEVTWHITDLMLWRTSDTGIGLEDIASVLVAYAGAYAEVLRSNRAMGQSQVYLVNARFVYDTFKYPNSDNGQLYDGVEVTIDVKEVLSG
jgi:hypothetical protein